MSTRDSPGGKGGRCVRLTTYHPCSAERQEIRGLNLPGPPWSISTGCCGRDLYLYIVTNKRRLQNRNCEVRDYSPICVGFVVDEVSLLQAVTRVLRSYAISCIPPMIHVY